MADSSRDIKRRIQSVTNTQQITKAMEMIAAVKLRRAQERVERSRPYRSKVEKSLARVLQASIEQGDSVPRIAIPTDGKKRCLVVISSDRGLAGGYNANILRQAQSYLARHPNTQLVLVGRKARDFFRRQEQRYLADYVNLGDAIRFAQGKEISRTVQDFYGEGLFDHVELLYTQFVSSVVQRPVFTQVLPLQLDEKPEQQKGCQPSYWFAPSPTEVLGSLVPLFVDVAVYQALLEASASEQGARMNAMHSATDNASEIIEGLNLSFNRARQAAITKEISEIVGGAEALKS